MLNKLMLGFFQVVGLLLLTSTLSVAEVSQAELEEDVNALSTEVDDLARDISMLERELLFPPLTRLQVYVSLAADVQFTPRTMSLSIDAEEKSFHIYSDTDIAALRLGGFQRFWEGNVSMGNHELMAVIKGVDKRGRAVERELSYTFEKKNTGHSLEIEIAAVPESKKPEFSVKDWSEK